MNTEMLAHYRDHMEGKHRYTRQLSEPLVTRCADGCLKFTDWDFGFRDRREPSAPHVAGHSTRRANDRKRDPLMNAP